MTQTSYYILEVWNCLLNFCYAVKNNLRASEWLSPLPFILKDLGMRRERETSVPLKVNGIWKRLRERLRFRQSTAEIRRQLSGQARGVSRPTVPRPTLAHRGPERKLWNPVKKRQEGSGWKKRKTHYCTTLTTKVGPCCSDMDHLRFVTGLPRVSKVEGR
jgi:hypothetical protein